MKALICIPTYNERENVSTLIESIFAHTSGVSLDLLFIDDASPDGTGRVLDSIAAENSRVNVLHRSGKLGLATAYILGFQWGLERDYDVFFEMDADFSHDPAHLSAFFKAFWEQKVDCVCGSRYVSGGGVSNWSRRRLLLSRMGSLYAKLWLRHDVCDWTGGFNAWTRETLGALHFETIKSRGYTFQIEMKFRALVAGKKLVEIPIVFQERRAGQSKMNGSIVKEAVIGVARLRWHLEVGDLFD